MPAAAGEPPAGAPPRAPRPCAPPPRTLACQETQLIHAATRVVSLLPPPPSRPPAAPRTHSSIVCALAPASLPPATRTALAPYPFRLYPRTERSETNSSRPPTCLGARSSAPLAGPLLCIPRERASLSAPMPGFAPFQRVTLCALGVALPGLPRPAQFSPRQQRGGPALAGLYPHARRPRRCLLAIFQRAASQSQSYLICATTCKVLQRK